jgi:hypothetical protein
VANTRSHPIASWNPAAAAIPFTAQIVGIDNDLSRRTKLEHVSKIYAGFLEAWISFKSWPAENTGPYALRIIIFNKYEIYSSLLSSWILLNLN